MTPKLFYLVISKLFQIIGNSASKFKSFYQSLEQFLRINQLKFLPVQNSPAAISINCQQIDRLSVFFFDCLSLTYNWCYFPAIDSTCFVVITFWICCEKKYFPSVIWIACYPVKERLEMCQKEVSTTSNLFWDKKCWSQANK